MPTPNSREQAAAADIVGNLDSVRGAIANAARRAGREAGAVTLIAVTKLHGPARIEPALAAGHRHFGENRVQEAAAKWPALKERYPDTVLHLIGPLQTNKVRDAVALFDVIHSLDRPKLARKLKAEMDRAGRDVPCYVQVNTGEEEQKSGVPPAAADALVALARDELGLTVAGLMCLPPADEEVSLHFALLREIARRNGLDGLSMGMSHDYEVAVAFGATAVRVGTAIFGERPAP